MSTTTTQQAEPKHIVFVLNKCIEICMDGEKGYAAAGADVRNPSLKALLQQKSKERSDFVVALQSAIQKLGAFAENEGTAKGTAHRGWMDVRLALEGRNDRVIVEEWARGEEAALKAYQKAMVRAPLDTLPNDLRTLVQGQYAAIQAGLDEARRQLTMMLH